MRKRQNGHAAVIERGHGTDVELLIEEIRSEILDRTWPSRPDVRLVTHVPPVDLESSDLKEFLTDLIWAALGDPQAIGAKALVSGRDDATTMIFSVTSGREHAFNNGYDIGRARAIVARNHGRLWLDQSGSTVYTSFQRNGNR
jgi:hypothetical protein